MVGALEDQVLTAPGMRVFSPALKPRSGSSLVTHFLQRYPRTLPARWLVLRLSDATSELVVSCHDVVQIRKTRAGLAAHTYVKGDRDQAYATALSRFASYIADHSRDGPRLRVARPLVQQAEAPGRWLVRIGLIGMESAEMAAAPRTGKVRISLLQAETLAVLGVRGRPTDLAVAQADVAILDAIAGTKWTASGEPMTRLHAPPSILPFAGCFEVALPVTNP